MGFEASNVTIRSIESYDYTLGASQAVTALFQIFTVLDRSPGYALGGVGAISSNTALYFTTSRTV